MKKKILKKSVSEMEKHNNALIKLRFKHNLTDKFKKAFLDSVITGELVINTKI